MSQTLYHILFSILAMLCFTYSVRARVEGVAESDEFVVVTNVPQGCSTEDNIKKHFLNSQIITDVVFNELKQNLSNIDIHMQRTINKMEDSMRDMEDAIDMKLTKLERRMLGKLRDYLDSKFDEIDTKIEKQNQNMNRELKNISDTQDVFNRKIKELTIKIGAMEHRCNVSKTALNTLQDNVTIYSSQKLDSLKIAMNETTDLINTTVSVALHSLYRTFNDDCAKNMGSIKIDTSKIITKLNDLVSITQNCTAVEPSPADVPSNTTDESRPIVWSQCKQEEVEDTPLTVYNYSKPLYALDDEALRHVTLRRAGGRLEYLHMRLGLQTRFRGFILLSPEKEPKDTGSYLVIGLYQDGTYIYRVSAGESEQLHHVDTGTDLSPSQPAAVLLTVSGDTLQVRHEYNSAPFVEYKDERFRELKYFRFSSAFNYEHKVKFYYDC